MALSPSGLQLARGVCSEKPSASCKFGNSEDCVNDPQKVTGDLTSSMNFFFNLLGARPQGRHDTPSGPSVFSPKQTLQFPIFVYLQKSKEAQGHGPFWMCPAVTSDPVIGSVVTK